MACGGGTESSGKVAFTYTVPAAALPQLTPSRRRRRARTSSRSTLPWRNSTPILGYATSTEPSCRHGQVNRGAGPAGHRPPFDVPTRIRVKRAVDRASPSWGSSTSSGANAVICTCSPGTGHPLKSGRHPRHSNLTGCGITMVVRRRPAPDSQRARVVIGIPTPPPASRACLYTSPYSRPKARRLSAIAKTYGQSSWPTQDPGQHRPPDRGIPDWHRPRLEPLIVRDPNLADLHEHVGRASFESAHISNAVLFLPPTRPPRVRDRAQFSRRDAGNTIR